MKVKYLICRYFHDTSPYHCLHNSLTKVFQTDTPSNDSTLRPSISNSSLFIAHTRSEIQLNSVIMYRSDQINCVVTNECCSMRGVWYKWRKIISTQSTSLQTHYLMLMLWYISNLHSN